MLNITQLSITATAGNARDRNMKHSGLIDSQGMTLFKAANPIEATWLTTNFVD